MSSFTDQTLPKSDGGGPLENVPIELIPGPSEVDPNDPLKNIAVFDPSSSIQVIN